MDVHHVLESDMTDPVHAACCACYLTLFTETNFDPTAYMCMCDQTSQLYFTYARLADRLQCIELVLLDLASLRDLTTGSIKLVLVGCVI